MTIQQQITADEQFLLDNKNKESVIVLDSGLQYKVIKSGESNVMPKIKDSVTVHYSGQLIDGTVFDSSYKRNMPATFGVNQVIAGWVEALQLMTVGSVWELYIPSKLAYGIYGAPPIIGSNKTLIFQVELLSIN